MAISTIGLWQATTESEQLWWLYQAILGSGGVGENVNIASVGGNAVTTSVPTNLTAAIPTGANTIGSIANTSFGITGSIPAGTNVIGGVTTQTTTVQVAPTVTASTYTAGYSLGGLLTFTNAFGALGSGVLQDISVISKGSVQTTALKLYLFNASPTQSYTDHAAVAWTASDYTKLIGVVNLSSTDSTLGTMTVWSQDSIGKAIALGAGVTTLYGVLVVGTTTTNALGSTADIAINLTVLKDG